MLHIINTLPAQIYITARIITMLCLISAASSLRQCTHVQYKYTIFHFFPPLLIEFSFENRMFSARNLETGWGVYYLLQKFHHEVELDIWWSPGLGPVCCFWHSNGLVALAFVQFCSSRVVKVTVQSNSSTSPASGLSLCFSYELFCYSLSAESFPNSNVWYVCNTFPDKVLGWWFIVVMVP